jgi:hypothetical protein
VGRQTAQFNFGINYHTSNVGTGSCPIGTDLSRPLERVIEQLSLWVSAVGSRLSPLVLPSEHIIGMIERRCNPRVSASRLSHWGCPRVRLALIQHSEPSPQSTCKQSWPRGSPTRHGRKSASMPASKRPLSESLRGFRGPLYRRPARSRL